MAKAASYRNKLQNLNAFFLTLTFLCLITGEVFRLALPGFGSVRILDLLVAVTVFSSLFILPKSLIKTWPVRFFLTFTLVNIFSLIVSFQAHHTQVIPGIVHFVRLLLYFSIYPSILLFVQKYSQQKLNNLIVVAASIIAAIGLVQFFVLPDIGFLSSYGWDPHRNRVVSTWLDPNFLASFLVLAIAILFSQLNPQNPLEKKKGQLGLMIVLVTALVLTFSRSGLVSIVIFALLVGLKYYPKQLVIILLGLMILVFTYSPLKQRVLGIINPDITASARFISWSESIRVGLTNPVIGIGYNNYSIYKNDTKYTEQKNSSFGADSSILLTFSTTGVLGMISFFAVFFYSIIIGVRKRTKSAFVLVAALVALLVGSNFNNLLLYPLIMPVYLAAIISINGKKR